MSSNYAGFDVNFETVAGIIQSPSSNAVAVASATDVDAANDKILRTAHPFLNDDVLLYTAGSVAIPGLTDGGHYYVVSKTTNDFKLSATQGGSAINLTGTGTGTQTFTQVAVVKIRAEGLSTDAAESPLYTDANGDIGGGLGGPGGTLAVIAPGTVVNFRVECFRGMAFNASQFTT